MPQFDPNFKAQRHVFCAILEQAVDDWRALQRAGLISTPAVGLRLRNIMHGRSEVRDMGRADVASLLSLLTTTELDHFCAGLNNVINPDAVRRALGISRPKLLDFIASGNQATPKGNPHEPHAIRS